MSNQKIRDRINRRTFMGSAAAAGVGLVLSPSAFGQNCKEKTDDINVALLGAGEQGQVLMNACMNIPGIRFTAVCDIWEAFNLKRVSGQLKKLTQQNNNTYTGYKEMLDKEKDLDAVIIATPDFCHADQTVACLEAKLHVYCEKEMSNTLEGARRMVQAAKKTGKLLQIGHQRRSNPRYLYCYEKLIEGTKMLGRITTINGQWNRSKSACEDLGWGKRFAIDQATLEKYGYKSMHQFKNWRWYKGMGGGPIVDLGSHQIDIYNWFLGANPKSVIASGGIDYWKGREWYDNVIAIYEYETKLGTVRASYQTLTTNGYQGYFEVFMGDEGSLQISEAGGRTDVYRESSAPKWDKWVKLGYLAAPVEEEKPDTDAELDLRETIIPPSYEVPVTMEKKYHQPHLENFFDAIRGKAKLNCPAEVGYETAVTVLKVNEAVEAARRLDFKPEEFKV